MFPWKRVYLFIWTNLNSLHWRMLCAKFGWNWFSGRNLYWFSGRNLLMFLMYFPFFFFCYYLPLVKGLASYLNRLEYPLSKNTCQNCLKLAQWFWRFLLLQTLNRATTPLARYGSVRFLHGTLPFLNSTLRFLHGTFRFLHGTVRFLNGTVRILHGTFRFLHGTVRFFTPRFVERYAN